jgi:hypothetical protein
VPSTFDTKWQRNRPGVVRRERGSRHDRTEVTAADADVDDIREARAASACPAARVHRAHEIRALPAHAAHFSRKRRERGRELGAGRPAQQGVQGRAVLGVVDVFAAEERFDSRPELARLGERQEGIERRPVEPLAAEIQEQARGLARKMSESSRICGKQVAHGHGGEAPRVAREFLSQGSSPAGRAGLRPGSSRGTRRRILRCPPRPASTGGSRLRARGPRRLPRYPDVASLHGQQILLRLAAEALLEHLDVMHELDGSVVSDVVEPVRRPARRGVRTIAAPGGIGVATRSSEATTPPTMSSM